MKVLFIVEPFTVEPLGIAYLAAAIKNAGHEAELLKTDDYDFVPKIKSIKPDFLAYSITTGKQKKFLLINQGIRTLVKKIHSVWGGSHPTFYPEFIYDKGVDTIIRGEGEWSFVDFLNNPYYGVSNLAPLERDLDKIAFPDREFLYAYPENYNNPIKNIITSRGCRFSCPYCFNSIYKKLYQGQKWVRYRSPANVIQECLELKHYPLEHIYFEDDEFLTNPHIEKFLYRYGREVKVKFHCQIRIEYLTEDIARLLKEAGCQGVTFAIESGNDYIRKVLLRRNTSKETIIKGAEILHKHNIMFRTENMVGLPGETVNQMLETLDLNIQCRPKIAWASIFQPYPSTPLGQYCKDHGLWEGEMDEFNETFFESSILKTPIQKQIGNLQKLFSFITSFPILRPLAKLLISVPNNKYYKKLYFWWKQRCYDRLFKK